MVCSGLQWLAVAYSILIIQKKKHVNSKSLKQIMGQSKSLAVHWMVLKPKQHLGPSDHRQQEFKARKRGLVYLGVIVCVCVVVWGLIRGLEFAGSFCRFGEIEKAFSLRLQKARTGTENVFNRQFRHFLR